MADKINRREFMTTTAGAGILAAAHPFAGIGGPAVIVQGTVQARRDRVGQWPSLQERRHQDVRRDGLRKDDGAATTSSTRSSPASTSSSSIPRTRASGTAGCRTRDGVVQLDSCCMHGPTKRAGGVGAHRGRQDAVARRQGGDGAHRPSSARRQGRADVRAQSWDSRSCPTSTRRDSRAAWLEWKKAHRSHALHQGSRGARGRRTPGHARHGQARAHRREPHLRHDQLQRRQRQGRRLRRDDDERAGLEDSGPARRLADSRRRPLRGRRRRRGGIDRPRRSEPLRPVLVS